MKLFSRLKQGRSSRLADMSAYSHGQFSRGARLKARAITPHGCTVPQSPPATAQLPAARAQRHGCSHRAPESVLSAFQTGPRHELPYAPRCSHQILVYGLDVPPCPRTAGDVHDLAYPGYMGYEL